MLRRVGPEPPGRLLELALAADAVRAAGLIPRDGHVDEALVEVALGLFRRPPGELELLVRREELSGADQLDAAQEPRVLRVV